MTIFLNLTKQHSRLYIRFIIAICALYSPKNGGVEPRLAFFKEAEPDWPFFLPLGDFFRLPPGIEIEEAPMGLEL